MNAAFTRRGSVIVAWLTLAALPLMARTEVSAPSSKPIVEAIQPFVEKNTLAGAVALVADKDKILSLDTVGFMDIAGKKPMQADAMFWIASQSKSLTGAALMILVDEGKVKLDDPIEKFLPEFKTMWVAGERDAEKLVLKKPRMPITVRQIMSHTSGMPFKSMIEDPTLDMLYLKDAVRSYAMTPLVHEPGSKYLYSNCGINTGGRIIEVVSGMPYEDFMQKRLFGPLGMKDTTFWPTEEQAGRIAKTYKPNAAKDGLQETKTGFLHYPLTDRRRQPMPGGGLFSTAGDVARFCQMVLNNGTLDGKRILSPEAVAAMTSKQTGDEVKEGYGIGFSTGTAPGSSFGHGGALATNMNIDPKRGLITIWLVQHEGFPGEGGKAQGVFKHVAETEFGKK
jgi:CubicO group peptidase (beta-lactamase class C family)